MSSVKRVLLFAGMLPAALGGCGLFVPEKDIFRTDKNAEGNFETLIVNNIKCELHKGVQDALKDLGESPRSEFLRKWGAIVQLKITVDETSGLNPGGSLTTPFANSVKTFPVGGNVTSPQSFSLGFGVSGTAHATRVETISFTYAFEDLLAEGPQGPCNYENGVMIESDLKIAQFIYDKMLIATDPGLATAFKTKGSPFSVFSDEITFVATFGGNITPTWKFARASANPTGTLFGASRMNTDDVIITLGEVTKPATATSPAQVSTQAQNVHNANLIGSAAGSSVISQAP